MPLIEHRDTIDIVGANGDFCCITDEQLTWGPLLAPGSTGLYDLPIQTNWGNYAFGQYYQSYKYKRRDVVWTMWIINPDTGDRLSQDELLWHTIYSRWKDMFSPDKDATAYYRSIDGDRTLGLRKTQGDKSFSTANWEGIDPHIFKAGSVVQTMGCELPFYVGAPIVVPIEFDGSGNFWEQIPFYNPGTVPTWPKWELSYGAQYVLPDYSFGNNVFARGISDGGKTIITPAIVPGDGIVRVNTRPDKQSYVSQYNTPVYLRAQGADFEYPIPPGEGTVTAGATVRAINVTDGCSLKLTIPTWYESPFSTPMVF